MLPTERYKQGETWELLAKADDDALTAKITVKTSADAVSPTLTATENFVDGEAYFSIPLAMNPATYVWQLTYTYQDGSVDKFPLSQDCADDECAFGELVICPSLDGA